MFLSRPFSQTPDHFNVRLERLNDFSEYLRTKGLKVTNQRLLVAKKIFAMNIHFTVDHLVGTLKASYDKISRATIYRVVSVMLEAGLLEEHDFGQSAKYYEQTDAQEHHDHMICTNCGYIEEFCDQSIEQSQLDVSKKLGFELAEHSLNLYGNCLEFQKKGSCERMNSLENA